MEQPDIMSLLGTCDVQDLAPPLKCSYPREKLNLNQIKPLDLTLCSQKMQRIKEKLNAIPKAQRSGIWDILQGNWPVFLNSIILIVKG